MEKKRFLNEHENLITKCKLGDRKAQFELYRVYYKAMFNTSYRITNNLMDAEDIMQEAFLKAFQSIDSYKHEVSFGAWLKKIVINRSLDYLRKKKLSLINLEESSDFVSEETVESWEIDAKIKYEEVLKEISELPEGYRIIISLYLLEGYDHEEIAGILNITTSTSRSQLNRAKKRLIENLNKKRQ